MNTEAKSDTRWGEFKGDIYPVRIMLFLGNRKEMGESIAEALGKGNGGELDATQKEFVGSARAYLNSEVSALSGECSCLEARNGAKLWIVRVDDFDGSVDGVATLSHECLHAAVSALECCGVSENSPHECLCYLHEAIFKKFLMCASAHIGLLRKHPPKR